MKSIKQMLKTITVQKKYISFESFYNNGYFDWEYIKDEHDIQMFYCAYLFNKYNVNISKKFYKEMKKLKNNEINFLKKLSTEDYKKYIILILSHSEIYHYCSNLNCESNLFNLIEDKDEYIYVKKDNFWCDYCIKYCTNDFHCFEEESQEELEEDSVEEFVEQEFYEELEYCLELYKNKDLGINYDKVNNIIKYFNKNQLWNSNKIFETGYIFKKQEYSCF